MKMLLSTLLLMGSACATGQTKASAGSIHKEKFHFGQLQDEEAGYTQAVKVGSTIYVSGTVSRTLDSVGIKRLYSAIEKTLAHYGAGMQHVVKENLYTTDIEAMKANNAFRKRWYKGDYPAATWVQVSRLFMEDLKLEVEVTAVLPQ